MNIAELFLNKSKVSIKYAILSGILTMSICSIIDLAQSLKDSIAKK